MVSGDARSEPLRSRASAGRTELSPSGHAADRLRGNDRLHSAVPPLRCASAHRMLIPYLALVTTATLNILGGLSGFNQRATVAIAASPLPLAIAVVNMLVLLFLIGHLIVTSWSVPEAYLNANHQGAGCP